MQVGYEHCVPKKKSCESRRKVLIFRNRQVRNLDFDNGVLGSCEPVTPEEYIWFGPAKEKTTAILEGGSVHLRQELYDSGAHK